MESILLCHFSCMYIHSTEEEIVLVELEYGATCLCVTVMMCQLRQVALKGSIVELGLWEWLWACECDSCAER